MSQTHYPDIFTQLQEAIAKLDTESASLTDAVQEYARGLELKTKCIAHLDSIENAITSLSPTENINPDLSLEDIFNQLETLELAAQNLPDNHLETLLDIVANAESLVQAGEQQIQVLQRSLTVPGATDV